MVVFNNNRSGHHMKHLTISKRLYTLVVLFLAILAAALTSSLFGSYRGDGAGT